ncbi:hypothetical protein NDU88_006705 [Pleurodeles waltl]|uniref:Peptidase A2 domain-containing protein n=1 Tax=Pleurodeles waltl TaxID=8319 RepID=A0AAV7X0Y1_PLEWA|nr:hypothetical protein NDU88_006705 [Pleurodeles waltl]
MINNSYADSDEDENVILMLLSQSQEDSGTVEMSSMMVTQKRRPPSCVVSVNNKNMKFLADSGSPFTLINVAGFKDIDEMVVQESRIKIVAYGGKHIEVVGKFKATIRFKGKCEVGTVYVIKKGVHLLGWFLAKNNSICQMGTGATKDWIKDYPDIFAEGVVKLKGFQHCIILKQGAKAVANKVLKAPLALCGELKSETEKLC